MTPLTMIANLSILVTLLSVAVAQRQPSKEVITKFREIAPQYISQFKTGETKLAKIRNDSSDTVAMFHQEIITIKETFVLEAIKKESELHERITSQREVADFDCLKFLNTSIETNINLAGIGFTNCINIVDDSFQKSAADYYRKLGVQAALIAEFRLLDVFRGNNVFYSPLNIIENLNSKLNVSKVNPDEVDKELEQAQQLLLSDLVTIRTGYTTCMSQGEQLLDNGMKVIMQQLSIICLGEKEPAQEAIPIVTTAPTIGSDVTFNDDTLSVTTGPNKLFNQMVHYPMLRRSGKAFK